MSDEQAKAVVDALNGLLTMYVAAVNSSDCGNWDPETEPEVIAARQALAALTAESGE